MLQQERLGAVYLDMQIDPVQQRPGYPAAISADPFRATVAQAVLVAQVATRAGVRCSFAVCTDST